MVSKSLEERNEMEAYIPMATKRIRRCQLYWILSIGRHDRTLFIAKKDKVVDIGSPLEVKVTIRALAISNCQWGQPRGSLFTYLPPSSTCNGTHCSGRGGEI